MLNRSELFGDVCGARAFRIAIIGSGPRGLSVLERLAAIISTEKMTRPIDIYLIDAVQVGCGRVWRTDQPNWFMMNTVSEEVSSFSGPTDGGPARPGAGPSLSEWWKSIDPEFPGPNNYAPRALHGRYMQFVLSVIERAIRPHARLLKITDYVTDLRQDGEENVLQLSSGFTIAVDKAVLVTGHSLPALQGHHSELAKFAAAHSPLRYLRGDSAADMPLSDVRPDEKVGMLGLGLAFYDVLASFTIGRGGRFEETENGALRYIRSGREPKLYAGSRSGMIIPARGRNQKDANFQYQPIIFTQARASAMRREGLVDFNKQVTPLILAEVNLMYFATAIRQRYGKKASLNFLNDVRYVQPRESASVVEIAQQHGMSDLQALNIDRIAHPFSGHTFATPAEFQSTLLKALHDDYAHAVEGNVDSPLKAAVDVIRDIRAIIRSIVDFGGLTPRSYREDFLGWYVPRASFLSAGPPRFRTQQAIALIEAGILTVVGPHTVIKPDSEKKSFVIASPYVTSSHTEIQTVIDARIPVPDMERDTAPFNINMRRNGIWTNFINSDGKESYITGGVAVTPAPFHPISKSGLPDRDLYVLGIPSEHTRWFMQAGSSRPGFWTDFVRDADAIAQDVLMPARASSAADQKAAESISAV